MKIRKTIAFFQVVSIAFCNFWNLRFAIADDSDIFGYNVKPNVMLALTSSTNMGSLIRSEPYVPGTTYNTPLTYITTTVYKYLNSTPGCKPQPKPCYVVYAASIDAVADSAARTALSTSQDIGPVALADHPSRSITEIILITAFARPVERTNQRSASRRQF